MSYKAQAIINLHPNNEWRSTPPDGYTGDHVGAGRFDPAWDQAEYDNNLTWRGPDPIQPYSAVLAEANRLEAEADAVAQTQTIYAPIEYPAASGIFYDPRRFAEFEAIRASQGRGKINRAPILDANGIPRKFATGAEIKALVDYIEDTLATRTHAAYDVIPD